MTGKMIYQIKDKIICVSISKEISFHNDRFMIEYT